MTVEFVSRLPELELEAQEHERKARALRQIIEGVKTLNGDAARLLAGTETPTSSENVPDVEDIPRGREAVRRIIAERPGVWRTRDIKAAIRKRGWPGSMTAIETAVARLAADVDAQRLGKGVYRFPPLNGHTNEGHP